jgi:hypothetical protein
MMIRSLVRLLPLALLWLGVSNTYAGVLPEDRADALYHVYQGDGITVKGPAILVRKKFGETISADVNYETDTVTGASIDSRTSGASSLQEHRRQWSGGVSYMRGKTTYNVSYMNSTESDYVSKNLTFGITEDMFGDLTTVTLGFTRGKDDVSKYQAHDVYIPALGVGKEKESQVDRRNYRLGLSQILTKNFIANLDYESSAMEGYLQNPYRQIRFGPSTANSAATDKEIYPSTRTTNAVGLSGHYYLPYRASIKVGYRYFTDSWGIVAHTGELEYVHPLKGSLSNFTLEGSARYYTQTHADFYADLFPFDKAQNFEARDKILATFDDWSIRFGASWRWVQSPKVYGVFSFFIDHIQYNYKDFRDATVKNVAVGSQPLFSYDANVYMIQYAQHF